MLMQAGIADNININVDPDTNEMAGGAPARRGRETP